MVNGKPSLTFGDNPYAAPSKVQQRTGGGKNRGTKTAGGFESYLPVAEYTAQAKARQKSAAPAAAQAEAGQRQTPLPVAGGTMQGTAQRSTAGAIQPGPALYPDVSYPGMMSPPVRAGNQNMVQRQAQSFQEALPTGKNSRDAARDYAQSALESYGSGRSLGSPAMRVSQKSSPRISDRPITGRQGFGMEDTRKSAPGRSTMALRGDLGYASPTANAMQARALGMGQNADFRGAGYAGSAGGNQTGQSFVTHGFGGGNAELALRGLGYDVRENQPAMTYARRLDSDTGVGVTSGGLVLGSSRPVAFASGEDGARTAVMTASHRRKMEAQIAADYPGRSLVHSFYSMANGGLGTLAAKFESGAEGISAIGFDRKGGTSYGKYQISSRAGTMAAFINYLDEQAPDLGKRLRAAGPANTGGRSGKMPNEWRKIASEDPARFEKLQEEFIRTSHFEPAMRSIAESTGLGFANMPVALQEVLFSTAVQHGPVGAVRIFNQAVNSVGVNKLQASGQTATESFKRAGRQLIKQVYALRAGQFGSSTSGVQAAVRNRLNQEMNEALQMLA